MYTLRDMHNRRDRMNADQEWRERSQNDPTSPGNWYRLATEEKAKNRLLDAENERKLKEQELKNLGLLDVAKTNKESGIEQQKLTNLGRLGEREMMETGATGRVRMANDFEREKRPFNQYKELATLRQASPGTDYITDWKNFKKDPELNGADQESTEQESAARKYQPVDRYDDNGNLLKTDYYNSADGKFAYSDTGEEEKSKKVIPNKSLANLTQQNSDGSFGFGIGGNMPKRKPFGQDLINSNLGFYSGLKGAHMIAQGNNALGNLIYDKGIKPAAKWLLDKY